MQRRIHVVDDSPSQRALLEAWLKAAGYEVTTSVNGQEALAAVRSSPPELVLTDLSMPIMDGLVLCRTLKTTPDTAHLPVILFTRMDDARDALGGLTAGADAFVRKGQKAELLERIEWALRENTGAKRTRRKGIVQDISQDLSLTSGRRAIFKVLFEALSREVPFDILVLAMASSSRDANLAVVVSARPVPEATAAELITAAGRAVTDLGGEEFGGKHSVREDIVLDDTATGWDAGRAPAATVRVPLIADGKVFGALAVHAYEPVPAFADSMRFFFDVGVESAAALQRIELTRAKSEA
jgi:CheY-like chemotaxis protein